MKKTISLILAVLLLTALLTACGNAPAAQEQNPAPAQEKTDAPEAPAADASAEGNEEIRERYIQLAHSNAENELDQFHALCRFFKAHIEELSGGKITVDVFGGAQLGTEPDYMEGMKMGTIDMAQVTGFNIGPFYSPYTVFDLPFLFNNREEAHKVFGDKEFMAYFHDGIYEQYNVKVLAMGDSGFRNVVGNKGPVYTPDDMKGYKIRVPGNEIYSKTFLLLGANPLTVSSSEKFTAVSQGTVDGLELPLGSIVSEGFHEICSEFAFTEHMYQSLNLCISGNIWEELNDAEKALFLEAADLAVQDEYKFIADIEAQYIAILEEAGVNMTEVDKEAFRTAVDPLYAETAEALGSEVMDKVNAKLAEIRG